MPKEHFQKSIKAGVIITVAVTAMLVAAQQYRSSGTVSTEPAFLYVQTAHSGTLSPGQADDRRILTLNDVSPNTVYFSDRPDRITGHEPTAGFVDNRVLRV